MSNKQKLKNKARKHTAARTAAIQNLEKFGHTLTCLDLPEVRFIDGKYCIDGGGELDINCQMTAYMDSLQHGWERCEYGVPVKSLTGYVSESFEPPMREDLGDMDEEKWSENDDAGRRRDPWRRTISVEVCGNGEGESSCYLLVFDLWLYDEQRGKTWTAVDLGILARVYAARLRAGHTDNPVIQLGRCSFSNPMPRINFVGWSEQLI
jgi:hypothetical protein